MKHRIRLGAGVAVVSALLATGQAWAQAPATERVSVNSDEQQANAHALELRWGTSSSPQAEISDDGRYVAWWSEATNLVKRDTNRRSDVFVRDRLRGTTARVSVGTRGRQANGDSTAVAMSADGRYVAFTSDATNLVPGDTNERSDVFVRDRVARTTTRVSVGPNGRQADQGVLPYVVMSADGNVVVFSSYSTTFGGRDRNDQPDVFAHDRRTGVTTRVSAAPAGADANQRSLAGSVSDDGRLVTFTSTATNLVANDTNNAADAFLRDLQTGTTTRIAENVFDRYDSGGVELSGDGIVVAYSRMSDVYLLHRPTGTESVFEKWNGVPPAPWTTVGALSADGTRVLYQSIVRPLPQGELLTTTDAFVRDLRSSTTKQLSVTPSGASANGSSYVAGMSRDGRWAAFRSAASDLVAGDTNRRVDLFVRGPLF